MKHPLESLDPTSSHARRHDEVVHQSVDRTVRRMIVGRDELLYVDLHYNLGRTGNSLWNDLTAKTEPARLVIVSQRPD